MLRFLTRMLMVSALLFLPLGCDAGHDHDHDHDHDHSHDAHDHSHDGHDHSNDSTPTPALHMNANGNDVKEAVKSPESGMDSKLTGSLGSTVAGIPEVPVRTGDFAKDKAALVAAIDTLTKAWDKNKAEYDTLIKDKKLKPDDPRIVTLKSNDSEFKKAAARLHQLYDELRGD